MANLTRVNRVRKLFNNKTIRTNKSSIISNFQRPIFCGKLNEAMQNIIRNNSNLPENINNNDKIIFRVQSKSSPIFDIYLERLLYSEENSNKKIGSLNTSAYQVQTKEEQAIIDRLIKESNKFRSYFSKDIDANYILSKINCETEGGRRRTRRRAKGSKRTHKRKTH
jgi:hypothetical protein